METYREPIGRFVVETLEQGDARYAAECRIHGIDPDDNWLLHASFDTHLVARRYQLTAQRAYWNRCREYGFPVRRKYRVRDRGEDALPYIERVLW